MNYVYPEYFYTKLKSRYMQAVSILGKKRAQYVLKNLAIKLAKLGKINDGLNWSYDFEARNNIIMSGLKMGTSWFKCPSTYKANQKALHLLGSLLYL